jgi:hypothetical protein
LVVIAERETESIGVLEVVADVLVELAVRQSLHEPSMELCA